MAFSVAAAALAASPAVAQQTYGAGVRPPSRPVATFATPYPSIPAPGPVGPAYDPTVLPNSGVIQAQAFQPLPGSLNPVQPAAPTAPVPANRRPTAGPRMAPGASGKVMYFHKPADALVPDGMVDPGALAMTSNAAPPLLPGVPDVAPPRGLIIPKTQAAPARAQWRPIGADAPIETAPRQPFTPPPLPSLPNATGLPIPPRIAPLPSAPESNFTPPPKEATQLQPRGFIFQMPDDARLHELIYERVAKDAQNKNLTPKSLREQYPIPPVEPTVPPGTQYIAKTATLPPGQGVFEPGFVIHNRLHFEEKNAERYGWDLGPMQPLVSVASFYKNMLLFPSSLVSGAVVGFWDTNAGKCLPGSRVPYYFYPQGLTVSGGVAEGLVITGLSFVIP